MPKKNQTSKVKNKHKQSWVSKTDKSSKGWIVIPWPSGEWGILCLLTWRAMLCPAFLLWMTRGLDHTRNKTKPRKRNLPPHRGAGRLDSVHYQYLGGEGWSRIDGDLYGQGIATQTTRTLGSVEKEVYQTHTPGLTDQGRTIDSGAKNETPNVPRASF